MTSLFFDQEGWSRGITTMPLPEAVRRDIERVPRRLADLVRAGSDVGLDFSTSRPALNTLTVMSK